MGNRTIILSFAFLLGVFLLLFATVPGEASPSRADDGTIPEWTVLMFMAGDNNLEDAAIDDFNELESVGSTEDVNLIVQIDRSNGYDDTNGDWTDTRRYRITKDLDKSSMQSQLLNDSMGEIDMSDPDELANFLLWGVDNYPARRYLVILWDHGLGWNGGVLNDQGTYMSIMEVRNALETVRSQWNHTFDLIGFDACLMGGIEVYYQLVGYANYSFGSGKNEPTDGLPYNDFVRTLVNEPNMSEEDLLEEIASDYVRSYRDYSPISVHYAGIDLTALSLVPAFVDAYVTELDHQLPFYLEEVREAKNETEEYEGNYDYFDFIDFIDKVDARIDNPRYNEVSAALRSALANSITTHSAWSVPNKESDTVRNSTGMTIYFPDPSRGSTNVPSIGKYTQTEFAEESLWDEFLLGLFKFNDEDHLAARTMNVDLITTMEVIDTEDDGELDTFSFTYNISSVKGEPIDNLTMDVQIHSSDGTMIDHETIDTPESGGSLEFNMEDHGFDRYDFHAFVWDEDGILQDQYGYVMDFQKYGVAIRVTMDDGHGNQIEPAVITILSDSNLSLNLRVTNLGNSREYFQVRDSGVPLKFSVSFDDQPFQLDPSETVIITMTVTTLERIGSGTDTFHVTVECLENDSASATEYVTIRVEGTSVAEEDPFPILYIFGILPLIVILSLIGISTVRAHLRNKRDEAEMSKPMDPDVEELLSFTKRLVEDHEIQSDGYEPPEPPALPVPPDPPAGPNRVGTSQAAPVVPAPDRPEDTPAPDLFE